jgi:hypothetical protein
MRNGAGRGIVDREGGGFSPSLNGWGAPADTVETDMSP